MWLMMSNTRGRILHKRISIRIGSPRTKIKKVGMEQPEIVRVQISAQVETLIISTMCLCRHIELVLRHIYSRSCGCTLLTEFRQFGSANCSFL
jgi:hypothetical protein